MIVGNGFLANAMKGIDVDAAIFFCSGVSDSSETKEKTFSREKQLLLNYAARSERLIYFSSYLVNFSSYIPKPYYKHKLEMEELVKSSFKNYTIFRLPQVVGRSDNAHTLANFIYYTVKTGHKLQIYSHVRRNLLDIDHVVLFVKDVLDCGRFFNSVVNIANPKSQTIEYIVSVFARVLEQKINTEIVPSDEFSYEDVVSEDIVKRCKELGIVFDDGYTERLIKKYYTN